MAANEREIILKVWDKTEDDVAIVKDVATKGKHIEMCIDYISMRKRIPVEEGRKWFYQQVENYICRLLREKLVFKAENVVVNVKWNIKSFYYGFAFASIDKTVTVAILGHLERKNPEGFQEEKTEYEFYYKVLKETEKNDRLFRTVKSEIKRVNLHNLYKEDELYRKKLIVRTYFGTKNNEFLDKLEKRLTWIYIVEQKFYKEIILWLDTYLKFKKGFTDWEFNSNIHKKYLSWSIDEEMFNEAIEILVKPPELLKDSLTNQGVFFKPSEALRNAFAGHGIFFPDEKDNIQKILYRLFTTEAFSLQQTAISNLRLNEFLIENGMYSLLLERFVQIDDLEKIALEYPDKKDKLDLILALKSEDNNINSDSDTNKPDLKSNSYYRRSKSISKYLSTIDSKFYEKNPQVLLAECFLNCDTFEDLIKSKEFNIIVNIPYIQSLFQRTRTTQLICQTTVEDLMKKFKNIDLDAISAEARNELVSFSNEALSSKYSQKFKLNFIYYLKQKRSAYAVYCLFIEQLLGYSQISKTQLFNSAEIATELAVSNYNDKDLVSHCVSFIEMIGFDSKKLRSYIRLLSIISPEDDNIKTSLSKITQAAEKVICESLINKNFTIFPLRDYTAVWNVSTGFRKYSIPDIYLNYLANNNDWWKLLIFCQYFDIPLNHINSIMKSFTSNNIGMNFLRALSCEAANTVSEKTKRRTSFSRSEVKNNKFRSRKNTFSHTTSGETMMSASVTSSNDNNPLFKQHNQAKFRHDSSDLDLFAIILLSSNNIPEEKIASYDKFLEILKDKNLYSTSVNLLKNSIHYNLPVLSILAATVNDNNLQWCWAIWLSVSSENFDLVNESKTFQAYALNLIKKCVTGGYIATLNKSLHIFYEDSKFCSLTKFLRNTYNLDFSDETVSLLQLYLLEISNGDIGLLFLNDPDFTKDNLLLLTVKLLILHLKYNFNSLHHQQLYLNVICKSGISDISAYVDFCLLKYIFQILEYTDIEVNLETFIPDPDHKEWEKIQEQEYERILLELEQANLFDKAIILAKLINYPIDGIIEHKWLYNFQVNGDDFDISECEIETEENSLPTKILIHFYLYITSNIDITASRKYFLLKKALDVIKKHHLFPNEDFDRDRIEYDMISCYLDSDLKIDDIELYYSEYFEKILLQERCVLYKSFLELKELAGVDDLTTSEKEGLSKDKSDKLDILLNKLLDDGDVVEALRLQAMFEHRTIDLHFIVFCMALAEGLTSIYNLSSSERMVLSDVVKTAISKFNRRTLGRLKSHSSNSSSPAKHNESIDSTLEFEEIPPREKQDVLEALQGLASRLKHGINLGRRIVMVYRSSMYLDKDYIDVLKTKDSHLLIKNAIDEDCLQKLVVISDIFISTQMTQADIADFLASEIVTAIIRPRFYIFKADQITFTPSLPSQNILWGYDLEKEFHFILELSSNTTMLGNTLLDYCDVLKTYRKYQDHKNYENDIEDNPQILNAFDSLRQIIKEYGLPPEKHQNATQVLSHKKQNTINVELLIKAHECFVHECSMEGIANVLMRAKTLNSILSTAKSWNLIVRLLTGIGRYREMYYCFDTLIKNEQFESLLGQFDEEKTKGLRQAIISYVHDNCPQNQEYLKLTALHFLMYKELAEMWENDANTTISKILQEIKKPEQNLQKSITADGNTVTKTLMLNCTADLIAQLQHVLENFTHSAENYLLDNKLRLASQSASNAELVAMQIDLVNRGMVSQSLHCISVLHIKSGNEFRNLVNNELSVPQALILERAYPYKVNWVYSIFNQYVIQDKKEYLNDYRDRMELTDSMIENIVKSFQLTTPTTQKIESNMSNLVEMVESVSLKYKLASILGFKRIITNLINDQSLHYLKDTNYGRNEIYLIDK